VDLHASIFPKNRMYLYKSSHTNEEKNCFKLTVHIFWIIMFSCEISENSTKRKIPFVCNTMSTPSGHLYKGLFT